MIRSSFVGIWACVVTVAGGYAGVNWQSTNEGAKQGVPPLAKMVMLKAKPVSIPIAIDGKIEGYVHAQVSMLGPADLIKDAGVKPDVFVFDSAFREFYSEGAADYKKLDKDSMARLSSAIKSTVNGRYNADIVHEVIIEGFGYTPLDQVRGGDQSKGKGRRDNPANGNPCAPGREREGARRSNGGQTKC